MPKKLMKGGSPQAKQLLPKGGRDKPPSTRDQGVLHQGKAHQKRAQRQFAEGSREHGEGSAAMAEDAKNRRLKLRSMRHKNPGRTFDGYKNGGPVRKHRASRS